MSDDGYYGGYSPYDELDDILYDADPGPDLADDLAEHVAYSPVYQDDPGADLQMYHSDWEYYSDDYYDDDPGLLRHNRDNSKSLEPQNKGRTDMRRGRKRKLDETENIPVLDLGERQALTTCIRGTVWATPVAKKEMLYREGQQEKVALLKNWKDVFANVGNGKSQSHLNGGKGKHEKDESWANDLSLADMGLLAARGTQVDGDSEERGASIGLQEDVDDGSDMADEENENEDEGQESLDEAGDQSITAEDIKSVVSNEYDVSPRKQAAHEEEVGSLQDMTSQQVDCDDGRSTRKRRKVSRLPSPPTSSESTAAEVHSGLSEAVGAAAAKSELTGKHDGVRNQETGIDDAGQGLINAVATGRSRKRKASPEHTEQQATPTATGSTASTRAKKSASTNVASNHKGRNTEPGLSAARNTRSRKK